MSYLLVAILFAPILYFAFRQKKWYLYLLMAFAAILPEQLSLSLHEKLPLISASRILIVIAAAFWLYQRIKERNFKPPVSILVFLGINLAISLFHLFTDFDEINRIFLFIAERALVVIMLADMICSKEEFDRCVDFLILGCCSLAVMGIVQTVFDYDIAAALHVRETITSVMISDRMGLTRAYATQNAISYGCYCAFMALPIYYRLENTKKQRYSIAFALNFVALIATFSRSAWLCILGIGALVFLTRPRKMLRSLWPSLVLIVVLCMGLSLIQPQFGAALSETAKSSWNTVMKALPDEWFAQEHPTPSTPTTATDPTGTTESTDSTDPTETGDTNPTDSTPTDPSETTSSNLKDPPKKPQRPTFELSEDFGMNAVNPTYSRTYQWSAVRYMMEEGTFVLGRGYNAFRQGQIYFSHKNWGEGYGVARVLDVGMVAVFAESGLLGMLSYLGLLGYMLIQSIRKRSRTGELDFFKVIIFTVPLYLLLNILAAFVNTGAFWLVVGLFYAYERLDKKKNPEQLPAER